MDSFINLAKQGLSAYEASQSGGQQDHQQGQGYPQQHQQQQDNYSGGQQHHQQGQGQGYPQQQQQQQYNYGGGEVQDRRYREDDNYQGPNLDHDEVVNRASAQSEGSGDSSLFSQALKHVTHNKSEHTQPIDEQGVQEAHREAYERGNGGSMDSGSMGAAAAMQAFKMFTQGGGGGGSSSLVSMAMGEAAKLFESSGGASSGNKQDVVNGAAMTVMKLVVQSKFGGGGFMGGGNSGGLSGLMGMAGKFL